MIKIGARLLKNENDRNSVYPTYVKTVMYPLFISCFKSLQKSFPPSRQIKMCCLHSPLSVFVTASPPTLRSEPAKERAVSINCKVLSPFGLMVCSHRYIPSSSATTIDDAMARITAITNRTEKRRDMVMIDVMKQGCVEMSK